MNITCTTEDFNCATGAPSCIPKTWVCDGEKECTDGSDEEHELCSEKHLILLRYVIFRTLWYRKCSTLGNWTCDERQFQCGQADPKCISLSQKCNDYEDCSDGSDEVPELCGKYI